MCAISQEFLPNFFSETEKLFLVQILANLQEKTLQFIFSVHNSQQLKKVQNLELLANFF